MSRAILAALLPIRDARDRVVGYTVASCPSGRGAGSGTAEDEARDTLEQVTRLARLAGRTILVPVTPELVRDGAISRFASTEAVWLLATDALDDTRTARAVERLSASGFHFALDGFPDGDPLSPSLVGSTLVLDAARTPPPLLASRVRVLLDAGLRPMVRGVDDRATRRAVLDAGAAWHSGRPHTRGAAAVDRSAETSVIRAITTLAAFADGRPPNATFDAYVENDPHIADALLRAVGSAALGFRGPRSVGHAMTVLGRDRVMDQLTGVAARLIGEAAGDPELGFIALRRARTCERLGAALDPAPHPRARAVAGLLSVLEFAMGAPSRAVAERLDLPSPLRDVLEDRTGPLGRLLDVIDAMEHGWWEDLHARCNTMGLSPLVVSDAHAAAWRDARDELGMTRADPN